MKSMACLFLLWMVSVSQSAVIHGELEWVKDHSSVTNTASFTFDTILQSGHISGFWAHEAGTYIDEEYPHEGKRGWLADGNYDFLVSESVSGYDELTDFTRVMWSIYEERVLGSKVEDVSGMLDSGGYHIIHWVYLMGAGPTWSNGTISVIPEPSSVLLLALGFAVASILRRVRVRGLLRSTVIQEKAGCDYA